MSTEDLKPILEVAAAAAVVGIAAEIFSATKTPDAPAPAPAPSAIPDGRRSGYKLMAARPGARVYQAGDAIASGRLPNKVDLRPLMTPIEDQGDTNSCVAHAVAGAYEYWIKKASHQEKHVSRLFVYFNARWRDGSQDKDDGSVIQLAMEGLSSFGACAESLWPFDPKLTLKQPSAEAYKDGATYRVHDMAQAPLQLEVWKQALAEGKPIVFGCEVFDSFDDCCQQGGVVTIPAPGDVARATHSGHSMCAVGYSDSENVFIVRNSWGTDWGDDGYCYIPYAYLMSDKFNDGDCWVFVPKVPIDPPKEVWSNDTTPVTNGGQGVDFPIQPYSLADYAELAVDFFENVRHPFNPNMVAKYGQLANAVGNALWDEVKSEFE
jgi:C1A family cysteine protease